ncbi:hypothetical protein [Williamsia deligens]|uniref:Uncharacterized protein n=1 Tax=Williamsia deligens TaxID=321325 RepID=A0ABW3G0Y3_9NOCA|nr:hypothetical protein [Williamsia deligens]MCP2194892.1 hypothetical protein [Williamsia deligens]
MSRDENPTGTEHTPDAEPKRSWWARIPRHLFGGRVRTTTAVMVLLFVGLLALYGQRVDHYASVDAEKAATSVVPRTTPSTTEEYVPETTYSSTRRSTSTTPSVTSTEPTTTGTEPGTGQTETAPTTTTGGLQFPTIPGLQFPGQTPTTAPAR